MVKQSHDQTPREVLLKYLVTREAESKLRGTAFFLVPGFANGTLKFHVDVVQDVTYKQAAAYGEEFKAFKWFPHEFASYKTLIASCADEARPRASNCADPEDGDCAFPCFCAAGAVSDPNWHCECPSNG